MSLILEPSEIKKAMGNIHDSLMLETMCLGGEIAAKAQAKKMAEETMAFLTKWDQPLAPIIIAIYKKWMEQERVL